MATAAAQGCGDSGGVTGRDLGGIAGPQHSIEFNGSNQLVDFGNVAQLNGATRYSISVWAKFDRASNYDTVYGKRVSDDDRATLLQAWQGKDVSVAVSSGYFHTVAGPIVTGRRDRFTTVVDGSLPANERLTMYLDGVGPALQGLGSTPPAATPTTPSRFTLGAEVNVKAPVTNQTPSTSSALVAYWRFDDGSTATDDKGAYNGTLVNAPTFSKDVA